MFYFQLFPKKSKGTSDSRRASPSIMKTFTRLFSSDRTLIHEIHSMSVIITDEKWLKMRKTSKVTVMDFMKALQYSTTIIERALSTSPTSVFEFKRACIS